VWGMGVGRAPVADHAQGISVKISQQSSEQSTAYNQHKHRGTISCKEQRPRKKKGDVYQHTLNTIII
jgi:hypothetical protein